MYTTNSQYFRNYVYCYKLLHIVPKILYFVHKDTKIHSFLWLQSVRGQYKPSFCMTVKNVFCVKTINIQKVWEKRYFFCFSRFLHRHVTNIKIINSCYDFVFHRVFLEHNNINFFHFFFFTFFFSFTILRCLPRIIKSLMKGVLLICNIICSDSSISTAKFFRQVLRQ